MDTEEIHAVLAGYWDDGYTDGDEAGAWHDCVFRDDTEYTDVIDGATVAVVSSEGGEGEGDSASIVWRISYTDAPARYFKLYGSYASYEGFYWDGPFVEVHPVERTVTFYEETK